MATYTVKSGDSLSLISQRFYGDFSKVDEIARANNVSDKNLIHPGMSLTLPDIEDAEVIEVEETSGSGKSKIGKYIGWGFGILALVLLANEARRQAKKNKASKNASLAGSKKRKRKK